MKNHRSEMKSLRPYCERHHPDTGKRKALKIHLTDGNCDVYGCPGYLNEFENGWNFHTTLQSDLKKHKNAASRSRRAESNLSIIKFFLDSLAKSSINGLNQCISSKYWIGKFIWFLVFSGCVIGFSYQTSHFYQLFKNKPSVVQIEVENDGEVDFPSVTVCNTNRIRRSAYCRHYADRCSGADNETLSEYEINDIIYKQMLDKKKDVKIDLGHSKTMFSSCDFIGTPTVQEQECLDIWEYFYDPDYGNCYTFTSRNKENLTLQARKVDFWQEENDLTLVMDTEPEEFMERKRSPGVLVVIHDEKTLPDIHTEGIFLTAGFSYTITVAKSTVILLPPPYRTNCTDYKSLPWSNLHKRRLTSRVCTVGCSQYFQFEKCNFVTQNLSLFYKELPYSKEHETEENIECASAEENRTIDYCRSICGLPCKDVSFAVAVSASKLSGNELKSELLHRDGAEADINSDIVHARIFYSTLEHKIFRHIPKYDTMELFSFLGGYSGVWLGFSLLTVYELIEIIVSTIFLFLKKIIRQRKHKKLVRTVMNSRKHTRSTVKSYKNKHYYG